jgi:lipoprotein LprG
MAATAMAAVLAAGGCGGGDESAADLPEAAELMSASADEMAGVETVRLVLSAGGGIAGIPVQEADAVVTAAGDAEGAATVELSGVGAVEVQFVLVGDAFHYQAVGPWLQIPREDAAQIYDPSAILDPDRGVANLLRNAQDPELTGTRGDIEAYQVTATFAAADLAALLPGVTEDVDGTLWIGADRPLLQEAEFAISGGTVTATLSEFDEPVEISEP